MKRDFSRSGCEGVLLLCFISGVHFVDMLFICLYWCYVAPGTPISMHVEVNKVQAMIYILLVDTKTGYFNVVVDFVLR